MTEAAPTPSPPTSRHTISSPTLPARPDPIAETRKNLSSIITKTKERYPNARIILAGMMIPPSMGSEYSNQFRELFPEIATTFNLSLIPFLLENVAAVPTLNLADGIHPNAEGYKIVADNVWKILKKEFEE